MVYLRVLRCSQLASTPLLRDSTRSQHSSCESDGQEQVRSEPRTRQSSRAHRHRRVRRPVCRHNMRACLGLQAHTRAIARAHPMLVLCEAAAMLLTTSRDQVGAERRAQPPRSSLLQTWQVLFVPETWRRMQGPHVRGSVPAAGPAAARNAPKGQQARGPRSGHQACGTTGTLPPRPIAEKAKPRVGNTATVATVHAVHKDREMLLIDLRGAQMVKLSTGSPATTHKGEQAT